MCYRTGKYTVCRSVRAAFSPEILQAGAVKGLKKTVFKRVKPFCSKGATQATATRSWLPLPLLSDDSQKKWGNLFMIPTSSSLKGKCVWEDEKTKSLNSSFCNELEMHTEFCSKEHTSRLTWKRHQKFLPTKSEKYIYNNNNNLDEQLQNAWLYICLLYICIKIALLFFKAFHRIPAWCHPT